MAECLMQALSSCFPVRQAKLPSQCVGTLSQAHHPKSLKAGPPGSPGTTYCWVDLVGKNAVKGTPTLRMAGDRTGCQVMVIRKLPKDHSLVWTREWCGQV